MTPFQLQLLASVQSVLTVAVAISVYLLRRERKKGIDSTRLDYRLTVLEQSITSMGNRLERAGAAMSELATDVQGLGERIRREMAAEFHSEKVAGERWKQNEKDHHGFDTRLTRSETSWFLPKRKASE